MSATYDVKRDLLTAFRSLMGPLVRILLRNGVAFREFADVIRDLYVSACVQELAKQHRVASLARVAMMTGLTRREVSDIAAGRGAAADGVASNANKAAKLLEAWHTDPEYLAPYGFPRDLSVDPDDTSGSFHSLVDKYIGAGAAHAMLEDLVRVGAARMLEGGRFVRVLKRTYIPTEMTPELVQIFTQAVRRYVETVDHNLSQPDATGRRFDRLVYPDEGLRESDVPLFEHQVRDYLETVIAEIDAKAAMFPRPDSSAGEKPVYVGVGLYFYREHSEEEVDLSRLTGDDTQH